MDVILLQDVDKVGLRGDVVSVSRGYMRNFLQPRRLAEEATKARVAELERRESERARHEARTVDQAEQIAETLRKTVLRFEVNAGPRGTLFGSVTATDVADEIWRTRKIRVDRRKIDLGDPIKRIGRYELPIAVFEDVRVDVKTLVVPVGGELPPEEELEQMAAEEAAEAAAAEEAQAPEELVEYLDEEEDVGVPQAPGPQDAEAPAEPVSEEEAVGVPDPAAEPPEAAEDSGRTDDPQP